MEDLEIIEESSNQQDYKNFFPSQELARRKAVWMAMSEIWLYEKITDYDLNYIAIRLADTAYNGADLDVIFHQEVEPVVRDGQYIMNSQWYVIEANWLEDRILKSLFEKKSKEERKTLSAKIFSKLSFSKEARQQGQGGSNASKHRWSAIKRLIAEMRLEQNKPVEMTPALLLPSA